MGFSVHSARPVDFSKLSDRDLYQRCRLVGAVVLKYRNQFLGMLPEVERRKLYRKYGMHSVHEFAGRLAGVSWETVTEILRVHKLLEDKPILSNALVSGEVGYTKLRTVATIATVENEKTCLERVKQMPTRALEVFVHELKQKNLHVKESEAENSSLFSGSRDGCFDRYSSHDDRQDGQNRHCQNRETISFSVSRSTAARIRVFKDQLEKRLKRPIVMEEVMEEFLKMADEAFGPRYSQRTPQKPAAFEKTMQSVPEVSSVENLRITPKCVNRHIPVRVRMEIWQRYRGVCAFPNCNQAAKILHHTERFSLHREHDPDTIVPLCVAHERIAHQSLIAHEEKDPNQWTILQEPDLEHPKHVVDLLVQKYRRPAELIGSFL